MTDSVLSVADEVIAAFGGLTKTARALKHEYVSTVQGWRESGNIPSWRNLEIIAAAKRKKVALPTRFLDAARTTPTKAAPASDDQPNEHGNGTGG